MGNGLTFFAVVVMCSFAIALDPLAGGVLFIVSIIMFFRSKTFTPLTKTSKIENEDLSREKDNEDFMDGVNGVDPTSDYWHIHEAMNNDK